MAKLILNPTTGQRRELALPRSILHIGRDPSNDLVLPDAMVSRRHAVIEYRGNRYYLRDCNSSNGSLVNGDRVSERGLHDGDLVAIGAARLLFRDDLVVEDAAGKVVHHPSAPRMQCPGCGADYGKNDAFCRRCGGQLSQPVIQPKVVCASCGSVVPLPATFCNACGAGLTAHDGMEVTRPTPAATPVPPAAMAATREASRPPEVDEVIASVPPAPTPAAPSTARVEVRNSGPRRATAAAPARRPAPAPRPRPVPAPRPAAGSARAADAEAERRLAAALIDFGLVGLGQSLLVAPAIAYWWSHELPGSLSALAAAPVALSLGLVPLALVLGAVYFVYYWGVRGATPGKRLLGLAVEGEDGAFPIGAARAVVRLLAFTLSGILLGAGFAMVLVGGRALHDRIASTRVVRREAP